MHKALTAVFLLLALLIIQTGCTKTPDDMAKEARDKLWHGKVTEAKQLLDKAAEADSTGAIDRYGRGLVREYNGLDWEAMISYLESAPMGGGYIPSARAFMDLSLKLHYLGNGLQMARAMMGNFPDNPEGYLYAGRFFARYHMHDSVSVYFEQAKEKGIDDKEYFLAQTEYEFVTGNNEKLTAAMNALSKKSYSDGPTCSRIADLYKYINFGDSALVYARKAYDDDDGNIIYGAQLGQYLFDEHRVYEADKLVTRLLQNSGDCSRLYILGAYIASDLGEVKRALELTAKHIDKNRKSPAAAVQQGDYLAHNGNMGGAVVQYQLAYTLAGNLHYPDDYLKHLFIKLENAQLEYGDITTAYAYYKESIDRFSKLNEMEFFKAELVLRFPDVADSAHMIVDDNLSYNWSNGDWMQRAAKYYRRSNQFDMAARCYKRLLELPQAQPKHALYMMDAFEKLNEEDSIVTLADFFPLRVRRDINVIAHLRNVYLNQGDTARGKELAEKLNARTDEYIPYLNVLAALYDADGQTDKAEKLYTSLADKYPNVDAPHFALAKFRFTHGETDKALTLVEDILKKDSTYCPAIEMHGKILEEKGDTAGALAQFRRVIDLRGTIPYSYDRVARYLTDDKDSLLRAEGLARSAIVFYGGKTPEGFITLGNIYMAARKYKLARTQYQKALKIDPNNAELYFMLGHAEVRAGEKKSAQKNLKKALEMAPDAEFANMAKALLK